MINIEEIKRELYQLDVMYGKAKAQVFMNATPVYVFDKENKLFRTQYNEETKHLLEEISKQHCEAIKRLAERYEIEIKDADDKEKMEAKQNNDNTFQVKTVEDAIIALICSMPPDKRCIKDMFDVRSQQTLYSQNGEITVLLNRGDGTLAENIFSYQMKETGVFEKEEQQNESNNDEH